MSSMTLQSALCVLACYNRRKRGYKEISARYGDRPFVLSRAFFAGTQRAGPIWTGDNTAEWGHLQASIPMLLSLGVTGLPFAGADVGGFFGNPDPELLTRWYQLAAYYPFFRGHAHLETKRREPWLFGEDTTRRIREAIRVRYRLLPQLYTLFLRANATGQPIVRPLFWEFPRDEEAFENQEEFMLGPGLLVVPALHAGAQSTPVFLPGDAIWYDLDTGTRRDSNVEADRLHVAHTDLDTPPRTFLRGGHGLFLRERARRSTASMIHDPLTLILAPDREGAALGELYLDDGHSYAHAVVGYLLFLPLKRKKEVRCISLKNMSGSGWYLLPWILHSIIVFCL